MMVAYQTKKKCTQPFCWVISGRKEFYLEFSYGIPEIYSGNKITEYCISVCHYACRMCYQK